MIKIKIAFLAITTFLVSASGPVFAYPKEPAEIFNVESLEKARSDMTENYARKSGWCDLPKPDLKKGDISIEWEYDEDGKCTVQTFRVEK